MASKQAGTAALPADLPEDFFDADKKSKKELEDKIAKEMAEWEKEVAARDAEVETTIKEQLERQEEERNIEEIDQQLEQWKRFAELEQKAKIKITSDKLFNNQTQVVEMNLREQEDDFNDEDESNLFDWRSKGL